MTIIKGVHFNKKQSIKMGKLILSVLFLCTTCTLVHDLYHRRLFDEVYNNEKRIWFIVDSLRQSW